MRREIRWVVVAICVLLGLAAQAAEPLPWVRNGRPTPPAQEMRESLREAERYGLSPESYRSRLSNAQLQLVADGAADADLLHRYDQDLSELASRFATHLIRQGRSSYRGLQFTGRNRWHGN